MPVIFSLDLHTKSPLSKLSSPSLTENLDSAGQKRYVPNTYPIPLAPLNDDPKETKSH